MFLLCRGTIIHLGSEKEIFVVVAQASSTVLVQYFAGS